MESDHSSLNVILSRAAWSGTVTTFLGTPNTAIETALVHQLRDIQHFPVDSSQIIAWQNCIKVLHTGLFEFLNEKPQSADWTILFEYELPRERGRRPDVVILSPSHIFVIEFKDFSAVLLAHLDQVSTYVRDLRNYHAASQANPVIPILLLTQAQERFEHQGEVHIVSPDQLVRLLRLYPVDALLPKIDPKIWDSADYKPLPSLVAAARDIFNHQPLPQIRRAQSAGIPETINDLLRIADIARDRHEHHLALVTGVPGAGKTLVGLQFVYNDHFGDTGAHRTSVFLSGNGPLVKVLQHALRSSVFVQDVHGFLIDYGGTGRRTPDESIFIFDEAQRAWDFERVNEKRGTAFSEPEDFLRIGERKPWALMIGLIGEGQEIHIGEESGLPQWNAALGKMKNGWVVHCAGKVKDIFKLARDVQVTETLNLTISLRTHLALHLQEWVALLLEGKIAQAGQTAPKIQAEGFQIYQTSQLEHAKQYVKTRYRGEIDKRYGLLASSKARNLAPYGVQNGYQFTKNMREGPWYNDAPDSRFSCCQLNDVATEFACQGLELDFPIVCWGDDLVWDTYKWVSPPAPRSSARNPHLLRLNSYRVLLTRGRDGILLFVPPTDQMRKTRQILTEAGVKELT